jgi:hypothetical protein
MQQAIQLASANKLMVIGGVVGLGALGIFNQRRKSYGVPPTTKPQGAPKTTNTHLLEAGACTFQSKGPLKGTDVYFVGFHPMKDNPRHQMEAHHYCKQVNEDFAQCLLYDGNTTDANLTGIEYILSEKLYNELPEDERRYWHPHNYEILSGQLIAPGLPQFAEKLLMKRTMNSYGKTFHTWRARCWEGDQAFMDSLPRGDAILAWSFNRDHEAKPELIETRDKEFGMSTDKKKQERADLISLAHPQRGVDYDLPSSVKPSKP